MAILGRRPLSIRAGIERTVCSACARPVCRHSLTVDGKSVALLMCHACEKEWVPE